MSLSVSTGVFGRFHSTFESRNVNFNSDGQSSVLFRQSAANQPVLSRSRQPYVFERQGVDVMHLASQAMAAVMELDCSTMSRRVTGYSKQSAY